MSIFQGVLETANGIGFSIGPAIGGGLYEVGLHRLGAYGLQCIYEIIIYIQWIPGHTDIHNNGKADKIGKGGSRMHQEIKETPYDTVKQIAKQNSKELDVRRKKADLSSSIYQVQIPKIPSIH